MFPDTAPTRLSSTEPPLSREQGCKFAAHQPGYHRNLYYFYKMMISDVFISLDNVQFVRNEWQNRQIFYYRGKRRWLTVPVNSGREPIYRKQLVDHEALKSHWTRIKLMYAKAPYFKDFEPVLEDVYSRNWGRLVDLCEVLTEVARSALGLRTRIFRGTDLVGRSSTKKGELLAQLIVRARESAGVRSGTLTYQACVAPWRNSHYLLRIRPGENRTEKEFMESQGIEVRSFAYTHPTYPQFQLEPGTAFQSDLSIFDLLFNCGADSRRVLAQAGMEPARLEHV